MPMATREQQKDYCRRWVAERRRAWLDANGPCRRCGATERLEVDHIDPKTKEHHAVWSWSKVRREAELSKCQVLCHACHAKKTTTEDYPRPPSPHGSANMYTRHKCRCDTCVEANRRRTSEYRARIKSGAPPMCDSPKTAVRVVFNGTLVTMRELATAHGFDVDTLRARIRRGMSPEQAVSIPKFWRSAS